jgi:hypothetical protein
VIARPLHTFDTGAKICGQWGIVLGLDRLLSILFNCAVVLLSAAICWGPSLVR